MEQHGELVFVEVTLCRSLPAVDTNGIKVMMSRMTTNPLQLWYIRSKGPGGTIDLNDNRTYVYGIFDKQFKITGLTRRQTFVVTGAICITATTIMA